VVPLINFIWLLLIVGGMVVAALAGRPQAITEAIMNQAQLGVETVLGFTGIMVLWLGMMKIAQESGMIESLTRLVRPFLSRLLPEVPPDHPAMGAILMNVSANMLGAGHAATPLGLKAMQELQEINPKPDQASNAMCTFLTLNTSSVTLVPATVIAIRAAAGSTNATEIVATTLIATLCSTAAALTADRCFRWLSARRKED